MFGYATDETEECMPLTVVLAHKLNQKIAELRRSGDFWWARPDSKTQVSVKMYNFSFLITIALTGHMRIQIRSWRLHSIESSYSCRFTAT